MGGVCQIRCCLYFEDFPYLLFLQSAIGLEPVGVVCKPKWFKLSSGLVPSTCAVYDSLPSSPWDRGCTVLLCTGRVTTVLLAVVVPGDVRWVGR